MLELDSDKRISAEQALAHPYLAQYADPTDEPASQPYDQTFEDFDYTVNQWKGGSESRAFINQAKSLRFPLSEYVWSEVQNFRPLYGHGGV